MHLLDTNACVEFLRGSHPKLAQHLRASDPTTIRLSAVTRSELLFGVLRSARPAEDMPALRRFLSAFVCLPFDDDAAEHAARVRCDLAGRGTPIGPNDLLIAATALSHDLTLVTHNTREFRRVVGLRIEDWQA